MKLHLPKSLRAAVLTCLSAFAAYTLGSSAFVQAGEVSFTIDALNISGVKPILMLTDRCGIKSQVGNYVGYVTDGGTPEGTPDVTSKDEVKNSYTWDAAVGSKGWYHKDDDTSYSYDSDRAASNTIFGGRVTYTYTAANGEQGENHAIAFTHAESDNSGDLTFVVNFNALASYNDDTTTPVTATPTLGDSITAISDMSVDTEMSLTVGTTTLNGSSSNGGTLTVNGSFTLVGTLTNTGTLELHNTLSLNKAIANTGTVDITGVTAINLSNYTTVENNGVYTYALVDGTGTIEDDGWVFDSSMLQGVEIAYYDIAYADGVITRTEKAGIIWAGTEADNDWNTTDSVWMEGETPVAFTEGSVVKFDDSAECKTVDIAGTVSAEAIFIKSDYTFNATQDATLNGAIVMGDNGSLTITTAQDAELVLSKAQVDAVMAKEGSSVASGTLKISDQLSGNINLSNYKVGENAHLVLNLVYTDGSDSNELGQTLNLSDSFVGTVVLNGTSIKHDTNLGAAKKVVFNGSGITFSVSTVGVTNIFTTDMEFVEGTTSTMRVWGNATTTSTNILAGKITGSGTIEKTDGGALTIRGDLSNFTGKILVKGSSGAVNLQNASLANGVVIQRESATLNVDTLIVRAGTARIKGAINGSNFQKLGAGTLDLSEATLNLSATVGMNYEGSITMGTTLASVAASAKLVYTGIGGVLNIDGAEVATKQWTLDLSAVDVATLNAGMSLGIQYTGDMSAVTLEKLGLSEGTIGRDANNFLTYQWETTPAVKSAWDANWSLGLVGAPTTLTPRTEPNDSNTSLNGTPTLLQDDTTVAEDVGSCDEPYAIAGGQCPGKSSDGTTTESDSWIVAEGGQYGAIIGGSMAGNYDGNGAANFIGNSHVVVNDNYQVWNETEGKYVAAGGADDLSIRSIFGGNYANIHKVSFTGNTYVSIFTDSVTGGIVGGSSSFHHNQDNNACRESSFVGNSYVYVYAPLTGTNDTGYRNEGGVVTGGSFVNRQLLAHNGNASLLIDLSNYKAPITDGSTGDSAATVSDSITYCDFSKHVAGAGYVNTTAQPNYEGTLNMSGSGSLIIRDTQADDTMVRFTGIVTSGMYCVGGDKDIIATLTDGANMEIAGGCFAKPVAAAAYSVGGTNTSNSITIGGRVNSQISGGDFKEILVGAAYADGGSTTLSVKNVEMTLTGGTLSKNLIGGYCIGESENAIAASVDNITLTLDQSVKTKANIYGGSYSSRNNADSTISQGSIVIALEGGEITGNIYAAGAQYGTTTLTTASTRVEIGEGINLDNLGTLSGGYEFGEFGDGSTAQPYSGSTVTGDRTLVLTDNAKLGLYTEVIDFNVVEVAENSTAEMDVSSLLYNSKETLRKSGKGTLSVSTAYTFGNEIADFDVTEGRLQLKANEYQIPAYLGDVIVRGEAGLVAADDVSLIQGDLYLHSGATLAYTNSGKLSMADGHVYLVSDQQATHESYNLNIELDSFDDPANGRLLISGLTDIDIAFHDHEGRKWVMASTYVNSLKVAGQDYEGNLDDLILTQTIDGLYLKSYDIASKYWEGGEQQTNWSHRGWSETDGGVVGENWVDYQIAVFSYEAGNAEGTIEGDDKATAITVDQNVIADKLLVQNNTKVEGVSYTFTNDTENGNANTITIATLLEVSGKTTAIIEPTVSFMPKAVVRVGADSTLSLAALNTLNTLDNAGTVTITKDADVTITTVENGGTLAAADGKTVNVKLGSSAVFDALKAATVTMNGAEKDLTLGDGTVITGAVSGVNAFNLANPPAAVEDKPTPPTTVKVGTLTANTVTIEANKNLIATETISGAVTMNGGELSAKKLVGAGDVSITGGKVTLQDDTDAFANTGTTSITGATLAGTWTADDVTIGGSSVADGTDNKVTIKNSTLTNTLTIGENASVSLTGGEKSIVVDSSTFTTKDDTSVYYAGKTPANSGFCQENLKLLLHSGKGTFSYTDLAIFDVLNPDAVLSYNKDANGNGWLFMASSAAGTVYYVNSYDHDNNAQTANVADTVVYDGGANFTNASNQTVTRFVLNGGKLVLATTPSVEISAATNGSVEIASSVSLSQSLLTTNGNTVSLAGTGTYDLGTETALVGGAALSATDWKGVVMTAATNIADLSALGTADSSVVLSEAISGQNLEVGRVGTVVAKKAIELSGTGNKLNTAVFENGLKLAKGTVVQAAGALTLGGNLTLAGLDSKVTAASLTDAKLNVNLSEELIQAVHKLPDMRVDGILTLTGTGSNAALTLNGAEKYGKSGDKYLTSLEWNATGTSLGLAAVVNENYVEQRVQPISDNGEAGVELLTAAFLELNPQTTDPDGDLAALLNAVDAGEMTDDAAAAIAGASVATLGMALSGDVERQLKAIRNRTTTMGVNECVVNEGMPYFNAWVNAEGNRAELDKDDTAAGYVLDSWGGTVGFDVDCNENLTIGLAITAMYGDIDSEGADRLSGDMDTSYVSLFARYASCGWTHTFVGTVGMMDGSYERTVHAGDTSYDTEADVEGMSFGLMYEVGYVMPLTEDATTCLQPVFNVMLRHSVVDSYTEDGSDAALEVGEQTMTSLTFGLGTRLQAVVGESVYNRASLLEARVLAKADVGDRSSEADVALLDVSHTASVESAELGTFGIEVGAGLSIPVGDDDGSIFIDGSYEYRSGYSNVNGTVGYRVNF